jgi:hypothetical protein
MLITTDSSGGEKTRFLLGALTATTSYLISQLLAPIAVICSALQRYIGLNEVPRYQLSLLMKPACSWQTLLRC